MSNNKNLFSPVGAAAATPWREAKPLAAGSWIRLLLAAMVMSMASRPLAAAEPEATPSAKPATNATSADAEKAVEAAQCRKNLARINTAIQAYRADNKQLPDWLSDLVPKYLDDVTVLTCPVTRRTGQVNNFGLVDPKLATSYLYEFCNQPIPQSIGGGSKHTMREWKEKQAELVGDMVPLVRCHQHSPQLNLSLGGKVYESTDAWEGMFTNRVSPDAISVRNLFPGEPQPPAPQPAVQTYQAPAIIRIPPRDPQAPSSLIDLTDYYNAGLNEGWHRVGNSQNPESDLSWLPKGIQSLAGTDFDVRGVVQLAGRMLNTRRFPEAVKGIRVNRKCSSLIFLHATGWSVPEGTPIGHYRVVFTGGEEREIPIVYGLDVRDWYLPGGAASGPDPKNSVVAWMGKSPATQAQGITLRLFKTAWENPLANVRIETIDYASAMTNCAPFLIAITAE
jgi:hypothetical protein